MALYSLFAEILDYPERSIASTVEECLAALASEAPEAHAHLSDFQSAIATVSLGQLQEAYINTFDLRPDCTPNLGYHLFGDDGRRGLFLAELKGRMETRGISLGAELPDHVSLLLRHLDAVEEERAVLVEDCLLPAISRMVEVLDQSGTATPYGHALRALLSVLRDQSDALGMSVEAAET